MNAKERWFLVWNVPTQNSDGTPLFSPLLTLAPTYEKDLSALVCEYTKKNPDKPQLLLLEMLLQVSEDQIKEVKIADLSQYLKTLNVTHIITYNQDRILSTEKIHPALADILKVFVCEMEREQKETDWKPKENLLEFFLSHILLNFVVNPSQSKDEIGKFMINMVTQMHGYSMLLYRKNVARLYENSK
ncbi:hypothetical protein [Helicobacter bizzozeronii]|uniref:hypothetical protein n=1 Tax=Helicobacter bizzozeronii TaxID=56877 RepID=UPI000CF02341|nr:hypothetical protein [Helicobacter bizzozeronii]